MTYNKRHYIKFWTKFPKTLRLWANASWCNANHHAERLRPTVSYFDTSAMTLSYPLKRCNAKAPSKIRNFNKLSRTSKNNAIPWATIGVYWGFKAAHWKPAMHERNVVESQGAETIMSISKQWRVIRRESYFGNAMQSNCISEASAATLK